MKHSYTVIAVNKGSLSQSMQLDKMHKLEQVCKKQDIEWVEGAESAIINKCRDAEYQPGTVVLTGCINHDSLLQICTLLRRKFGNLLVLIDAIELSDQTEIFFSCLEAAGFQLAMTEAALSLIRTSKTFTYAHAKADISSSVVVFFARSRKILFIKRKYAPFQGMYAMPGGFLRPLMEDLSGCGSRELFEETGLEFPKEDLIFVNVRSNPSRDDRGHAIDHGFLAVVPPEQEDKVVSRLRAGDDAESLLLVSLEEALEYKLAADYEQLLQEAVKLMPAAPFRPLSKLVSFFLSKQKQFQALQRTA